MTFDAELERCPCAPKCPCKSTEFFNNKFIVNVLNILSADCPCESYNCENIENSETSVLILYSDTNFAKDQYVLNRDGSKFNIS